jgi:hypothetical protein
MYMVRPAGETCSHPSRIFSFGSFGAERGDRFDIAFSSPRPKRPNDDLPLLPHPDQRVTRSCRRTPEHPSERAYMNHMAGFASVVTGSGDSTSCSTAYVQPLFCTCDVNMQLASTARCWLIKQKICSHSRSSADQLQASQLLLCPNVHEPHLPTFLPLTIRSPSATP